MIKDLGAFFKTLITKWVQFVINFPKIIIFSSLAITLFLGFYSAGHLGVITDTAVMLSEKLGYLKVYRHFKKEFPHSYNQIVILIEAITPDLAIDARDKLATELKKHKKLFPWIYVPGGDEFFKKNGLLFLSVDELETLLDNLSKAQPIIARLIDDTTLNTFFSTLTLAIKERQKGIEFDIFSVFSELNNTFYHLNKNSFYQMSWMRLMSGKKDELSNRSLIIVQPDVSYSTVLPGKEAILAIKNIAKGLGLMPEKGVTVMLTGDIPMEYDELKSVTKGAKMAGILSLFMVSIVLLTGLGSLRLVFATLVSLIAGLIWTASFAALAIGHLNMISVAFAVLFIGLGVDYAIHLSLRYRELIRIGKESKNAIIKTVQDVGPSLILCAITTSIGFYSFMPTDFSGVAELGLISGTGMFIALFANLTLLPAIISIFPLSSDHKRPYYLTSNKPIFFKIISLPYRNSRNIRVIAIILTICSFYFLPKVTFDSNPINLRDPNAESIIAFKKLLEDPHSSPWSLESLAKDKKELLIKKKGFERLKSVRHVITLESFIPKDQEEKLDIIADLDFILGPILDKDIQIKNNSWETEFSSIRDFYTTLLSYVKNVKGHNEKILIEDLIKNLSLFLSNLEGSKNLLQKAFCINKLKLAILGSFPKRMEELHHLLMAERVDEHDIPQIIRSQWIGRDGSRRIEIVPKHNPKNDKEIMAFIDDARSVDKNVTGYPVLIIEGGRAVVKAFKEAFTYSLLSILFLLLILMPHKKDAIIILYSLFFAALMSASIMVLFNLPLNFANIIALPLILGIGVDNGIHIVHRFRKALESPASLLQTSTARGILFSTLTTVCSFGNLAISPHVGMSSMGKLLTIGIIMSLISAIVVIPAFLIEVYKKENKIEN